MPSSAASGAPTCSSATVLRTHKAPERCWTRTALPGRERIETPAVQGPVAPLVVVDGPDGGPGAGLRMGRPNGLVQTARHVDRRGDRGHGEQVEMVIVQSGEQCAPATLDHHVRSGSTVARQSGADRR